MDLLGFRATKDFWCVPRVRCRLHQPIIPPSLLLFERERESMESPVRSSTLSKATLKSRGSSIVMSSRSQDEGDITTDVSSTDEQQLLPNLGTDSSRSHSKDDNHHHHVNAVSVNRSRRLWSRFFPRGSSSLCCCSGIRMMVLIVLCLQNSLFTLLRRYSQGVLQETYSKYEVLLVGEIIKLLFSAYMIAQQLTTLQRQQQHRNSSLLLTTSTTTTPTNSFEEDTTTTNTNTNGTNPTPTSNNNLNPSSSSSQSVSRLNHRLLYLVSTSKKMLILALIYGAMNILSFVSLRNIGAGLFTIFAQAKIFTTASFSALLLRRKYTWTQWRALIALVLGVLLFSEPVWGKSSNLVAANPNAKPILGTMAVLLEVSLSGFASIYFEKAIKTDPLQLTIWERNFQLALCSVPVYVVFMIADGGGQAGFGGGWSPLAFVVAMLGAAGGLLVALSIKYGDSILKTLATTGAIVLSSVLDHVFLDGPLTPTMAIAGGQVILAICNYTFDATNSEPIKTTTTSPEKVAEQIRRRSAEDNDSSSDEEMALLPRKR